MKELIEQLDNMTEGELTEGSRGSMYRLQKNGRKFIEKIKGEIITVRKSMATLKAMIGSAVEEKHMSDEDLRELRAYAYNRLSEQDKKAKEIEGVLDSLEKELENYIRGLK
jgi:hypothetical protein